MSMKELTIKDIEKTLEEIGIPEYPKYIGKGLWKLSENCITNEKGLAAFHKEIIKNTTMTQENKQLLLKDLCARLPYGVKIQVKEWTALDTELKIGHINQLQNDDIELKPYLRPMSSMTEEERKEYELLANHCIVTSIGFIHLEATSLTDWLNAHHFDYRGLIPMGLALEAPEGMYKI